LLKNSWRGNRLDFIVMGRHNSRLFGSNLFSDLYGMKQDCQ
jgi:hypothetical protein